MQISNQVETLSLRDLEDQTDSSLFVLNNTQPRGQIVFNVSTMKGRDRSVIIPDTWVPFDLSTQARKSEIVDSPDFRRAVSQRFLLIVSTASADEFFAKNELAQEELKRIFNFAGGNNAVASNQMESSTVQSRMEQVRSEAGGVQATHSENGDQISGAIIQIVARSNSDDDGKMDVKEALSLLVGRNMNRSEKEYVIKNSIHSEIKEFVSKQL